MTSNEFPVLRLCKTLPASIFCDTLMIEGKTHKDNTSGKVRFENDHIFWEYDNKNILQIDINTIAIIGEYTNSDGPYLDDWFLTFVTKDEQWQSVSMYADNIDVLTQLLTDRFQQDINMCYLAGSTHWKSIVRYPEHLKGEPLFKLTHSENYKEPKNMFDKILSSIGLGNFDTTQNIDLTENVKQELKNACR